MWQDLYVGKGWASCMFQSPERDSEFSNSTSSMIWPRTAIAAGSFWRYDPNLASTDDLFASVLAQAQNQLDDRLAEWSVGSCACTTTTRTVCNQRNYCGYDFCSTSTPTP